MRVWREGTVRVWREGTACGSVTASVAANLVLPLFAGHSCLWCLVTALLWVITLRYNHPEERSYQLFRVGSLKLLICVTAELEMCCHMIELRETVCLLHCVILQASVRSWCLLKCVKWWTFRHHHHPLNTAVTRNVDDGQLNQTSRYRNCATTLMSSAWSSEI